MAQSCEDGNCPLTGTSKSDAPLIPGCRQMCKTPYCDKHSGQLKGKIVTVDNQTYDASKIKPSCNWLLNNCKNYCGNNQKCKTILTDTLKSAASSDPNKSIKGIVNGVSGNENAALKQVLSDVVASTQYSSVNKKSKEDAYLEYRWFRKNIWDTRDITTIVMTCISLLIIFLILAQKSWELFKALKYSWNNLGTIYVIIFIYLWFLFISSLAIGVTNFLKNAYSDQDEFLSSVASQGGVIAFYILCGVIGFIFGLILFIYNSTIAVYMIIIALIGPLYFYSTAYAYSYAPTLMLFYTLLLIFGNFFGIILKKANIITNTKYSQWIVFAIQMVLTLLIMGFSYAIFAFDVAHEKEKNKTTATNLGLVNIMVYVSAFPILRLFLKVADFLQEKFGMYLIPQSLLQKLHTENTRTTSNQNTLQNIINQYFGFLNEDIVENLIREIYIETGITV